MTRRRFNGLVAELGGGLSSGATAITFAAPLTHDGGAAVPTLGAGDYVPLTILDAAGVLSEVVHLTAYTAAATTGTIVRGREGTTGVTHSSGDQVVQGPTRHDVQPYPNPRTPSDMDDEFDGASAAIWTPSPTAPTTWDIDTTVPDAGYLRSNALGTAFVGVHQPIPAYPFTVVAKVNSNRRGGGTSLGLGLLLSTAAPTSGSPTLWVGSVYSGGYAIQRISYNTFATSSFVGAATLSNAIGDWKGPLWLKLVATSATSIATYASIDGKVWFLIESGLNPGFTPGVVGVAQSDIGIDLEGVADFFRVT